VIPGEEMKQHRWDYHEIGCSSTMAVERTHEKREARIYDNARRHYNRDMI
jgi:hypothetical protein